MLVLTSCVIRSNFLIVTPTLTSTNVLSSPPAATSTSAPTSTSIAKTEVSISPSVELPIGDGGLLSGQPCESPCFFGVRLGETKLDQIIPLLSTHGLSPCLQPTKAPDWKGVVCNPDEPRVVVGVREDTLIVNEIGYFPTISFSVADIIAKYGEPNRVQTYRTQDNSKTWPRNSNIWVMNATLYWDSLAMEVSLPTTHDTGEHTYHIEGTTNALAIFFREEEDYMRYSREEFEVWHGYDFYANPIVFP